MFTISLIVLFALAAAAFAPAQAATACAATAWEDGEYAVGTSDLKPLPPLAARAEGRRRETIALAVLLLLGVIVTTVVWHR